MKTINGTFSLGEIVGHSYKSLDNCSLYIIKNNERQALHK